ncbi:hypothetical protein D3C71_1409990 [compost metagenome]
MKLRELVGSLRLARLGAGSPRAAASATARSKAARSSASAAACWLISVCSTGSRKAAVLPLPVWLETIKSMNLVESLPPPIAKGMALSCTLVGWV